MSPGSFNPAESKADTRTAYEVNGKCPREVPYVSTDLRIVWIPGQHTHCHARDLIQRDGWGVRTYRRLDLDYYRWLIAQLDRAEGMVASGKITADRIARARATMSLLMGWVELVYPPADVAALCLAEATTYAAPPRPQVAA